MADLEALLRRDYELRDHRSLSRIRGAWALDIANSKTEWVCPKCGGKEAGTLSISQTHMGQIIGQTLCARCHAPMERRPREGGSGAR